MVWYSGWIVEKVMHDSKIAALWMAVYVGGIALVAGVTWLLCYGVYKLLQLIGVV
jgi:hypothetical protein